MTRKIIVAGVDIGSTTSKAVLIEDQKIISRRIISTGAESIKAADRIINEALNDARILIKDVKYIVATGYGRVIVPYADETVTELSCHAKGATWLFPSVKTILDMGGQDCKAIRCDEKGNLQNFMMNDKCAAGTGRFLELMARIIGLSLDDLGALSFGAEKEAKINSTCAVFAKTEITTLIREGHEIREVVAGLNSAVSARVYSLLRGVGVAPEFMITGGIGKNVGIVRKIEERVGLKAIIPEEPQIVGALGAALIAHDRLSLATL